MVVVVVVPRRLADVVVRVAGHGRGRHGAQLVGVVVGVHGRQVGAAVHAAEVGAGGGGVALAVARRLVVRHGVGGGGGSGGGGRARHGTLHAGGVGRGSRLGQRGHGRSWGVSRGDGGAPDGGDGADGGRGAAQSRGARVIGGRGRGGGRAGDGGRSELAAALGARALPGRGGLLLGRPGLGAAAALLLLATLCPPVLEPHLEPKQNKKTPELALNLCSSSKKTHKGKT